MNKKKIILILTIFLAIFVFTHSNIYSGGEIKGISENTVSAAYVTEYGGPSDSVTIEKSSGTIERSSGSKSTSRSSGSSSKSSSYSSQSSSYSSKSYSNVGYSNQGSSSQIKTSSQKDRFYNILSRNFEEL